MGLAASFDHVAVGVQSLRESTRFYLDVVGGRFLHGGDNPAVGYRAIVIDYPGGRVELMGALSGDGSFPRFMARTGGGLHHITFKVDDFDAAVATLITAGYPTTGIVDGTDLLRREVFVRPRALDNTLVQVVWEHPTFLADFEGTVDDVLDGRGAHGTGEPG